MLKEKGIDLNLKKAYGPRIKGGKVVIGTSEVVKGTDTMFNDHDILKFIVAREWNLEVIIDHLYNHLEWRQTNIPLPFITDRTLRMLKKGVMYVHGRAKDMSPILVVNFAAIGEMIDENDIDADSFL